MRFVNRSHRTVKLPDYLLLKKTDGVTFSKENATPPDVKKISIGDVSAF